ncbi:MAG TPA: hypothetical protein PKW79_08020 [Rhabdochlamydiaceae bacterium]|nr:hypothetical protein [Rhabdochlamydiaceae bacterium]HNC88713.1 hypothetical protein [Anaerolineales bacterium]
MALPNTHSLQTIDDLKKNLEVMDRLSGIALSTRLFPNYTKEQLTLLLLTAAELGISPMRALNGGLVIVKGKVSMSATMQCERIRQAGHSIKTEKCTDHECILVGKRKDTGDEMRVNFTIQQAHRAGLTKNPTWLAYPQIMLQHRCVSLLARFLFADIFGSIYCMDEGREIAEAEGVEFPIAIDDQIAEIAEEAQVLESNVSQDVQDSGDFLHDIQEPQQEPQPAPETLLGEFADELHGSHFSYTDKEKVLDYLRHLFAIKKMEISLFIEALRASISTPAGQESLKRLFDNWAEKA